MFVDKRILVSVVKDKAVAQILQGAYMSKVLRNKMPIKRHMHNKVLGEAFTI